MNFYLIQRGTFKDTSIESIQGLDTCISMDYMGSSEFEWGALPASLKRIIKEKRKNNFNPYYMISILGVPFYLYAGNIPVNTIHEIENLFNTYYEHPYGNTKFKLKEMLHIKNYFDGKTKTVLKRGCKKKTEEISNYSYCDFWWDIENDWMVIPYASWYKDRLDRALQKLEECGYGKE